MTFPFMRIDVPFQMDRVKDPLGRPVVRFGNKYDQFLVLKEPDEKELDGVYELISIVTRRKPDDYVVWDEIYVTRLITYHKNHAELQTHYNPVIDDFDFEYFQGKTLISLFKREKCIEEIYFYDDGEIIRRRNGITSYFSKRGALRSINKHGSEIYLRDRKGTIYRTFNQKKSYRFYHASSIYEETISESNRYSSGGYMITQQLRINQYSLQHHRLMTCYDIEKKMRYTFHSDKSVASERRWKRYSDTKNTHKTVYFSRKTRWRNVNDELEFSPKFKVKSLRSISFFSLPTSEINHALWVLYGRYFEE